MVGEGTTSVIGVHVVCGQILAGTEPVTVNVFPPNNDDMVA